jgi:hypothetical protein
METPWTDRKPNPEFPACAQVAHKLLAEVYGCKPGDQIPAEAELMARAEQVAAWDAELTDYAGVDIFEAAKARTALNMVREIGGL